MEIENIKIYRGPYLYNCFWMALIPILKKWDIDDNELLLNIVPVWEKDEQENIRCFHTVVPFENWLAEYGIIEEVYSGDNLYGFMCRNIDCEIPVIVFIDCFYVDYIEDSYHKVHNKHCLVAYGYEGNNIKVIDHDYHTSLQYKRREVIYKILYDGYIHNMEGLMAVAYRRVENKKHAKSRISERLKNIKQYFKEINWIDGVIEKIQELQQNIHLIDTQIIGQAYQFGMGLTSFQNIIEPFLSNECNQRLEEFCSNYLILRACYYKICNTEKYKTPDFLKKTANLNKKCCESAQYWYELFIGETWNL